MLGRLWALLTHQEAPAKWRDLTTGQSELEQPKAGLSEPAPSEQHEILVTQEDSPAPRNKNTPYFIGAVIAVLVLIGVALYCKYNGRK